MCRLQTFNIVLGFILFSVFDMIWLQICIFWSVFFDFVISVSNPLEPSYSSEVESVSSDFSMTTSTDRTEKVFFGINSNFRMIHFELTLAIS
jgi:hypothetical protein